MISTWSGADKIGPGASQPPTSPTAPQATIPGFENFVLDRFAPLVWSIPGSQSFNPKDAQARNVLQETAALQMEIVRKVGEPYVERLRMELGGMQVDPGVQEQYLASLAGAFEGVKKEKEWRSFFVQFVERLLAVRG
jgi:exportin-T